MIEGKRENDEKIIHLYITDKCTNECEFCCNKQEKWNPKNIPAVTIDELRNAHTVLLTGGEPFIGGNAFDVARKIKEEFDNVNDIFVYTSGYALYKEFKMYLEFCWPPTTEARRKINLFTPNHITGLNISPKSDIDWECVNILLGDPMFSEKIFALKSNRLYLMNGDNRLDSSIKLRNFEVISRPWQEDFMPNGGIFRRLPILF